MAEVAARPLPKLSFKNLEGKGTTMAKSAQKEIAPNLKVSRNANILNFEVDLSKSVGDTGTGKSTNIAVIKARFGIPLIIDGIEYKLSFQLYRPKSDAPEKAAPVSL